MFRYLISPGVRFHCCVYHCFLVSFRGSIFWPINTRAFVLSRRPKVSGWCCELCGVNIVSFARHAFLPNVGKECVTSEKRFFMLASQSVQQTSFWKRATFRQAHEVKRWARERSWSRRKKLFSLVGAPYVSLRRSRFLSFSKRSWRGRKLLLLSCLLTPGALLLCSLDRSLKERKRLLCRLPLRLGFFIFQEG